MIYELKDFTSDGLTRVLDEIKKRKALDAGDKKTLEKFYGSLKWDIDGVEYQRKVRDEWD
jgi:hypothetical protein